MTLSMHTHPKLDILPGCVLVGTLGAHKTLQLFIGEGSTYTH